MRYIALLRAINVGGHNVKMDYLRKLFEEIGFSNVETFIASGNVIFDAPEEDTAHLQKSIESHLRGSLGYDVATFLRKAPEMTRISEYEPFPTEDLAGDNISLYVAFLSQEPGEQAKEKLMALRTPVDDFHIQDREVYWLCRVRMSDSMFSGGLLEKTLGMQATVRNSTTVKKLAAKYGAARG